MKWDNEAAKSIEGEGFSLRPWKVEDAGWYVAAREEVFRWTTEPPDLTVAQVEAAILQVNADSKVISFAIADQPTDNLLGNIALVIDHASLGAGEIMSWLAPIGRGRGIAAMAVTELCQWAFEERSLDRITMNILPGNIRSQRVAERAGFQRIPNVPEAEQDREYLWYQLVR